MNDTNTSSTALNLRFRDLLEAAPDAIFEVRQNGMIVLLNEAAEKMFGYRREVLLGQRVEVLVPAALRESHAQHRGDYAEHPSMRPMERGFDLRAVRSDGSEFPAEISLNPIRSNQGDGFIVIVRNISGRKQAEARINRLHEQYATKLAAANQQLEVRNRAMERANRLKSDFLASMSHELRTPLHTIIGFSDLLAEQLKGPLNQDQLRFVEHIRRDSRHLLELINDILDLSKIEAERLELHLQYFNTKDAMIETLIDFRQQALSKQIDLSEHLDSSLWITADRLRFKQIFYNLISNAIKFTPENGSIRITSAMHAEGSSFCVRDTGIGIPESEHESIFDKFYQVAATTRGVKEGTGLGLSITRRLVQMHGGSIWIESQLGEGTQFEIFLPEHTAAHSVQSTSANTQQQKDDSAI